MMRDFSLRLPEKTTLQYLTILPAGNTQDEIIQRAVVLMVAHEDSRLWVNGIPALSFILQATTGTAGTLMMMLSGVADALRDLLNAEEKVVDSVTFTSSITNNSLYVDINIQKTNGESASATIVTNE